MEKIEYLTVIKFLTKQEKTPQTVFQEMSAVYRDSAPGKTMIYKWHALYKKGRDSIEDDSRLVRPIEATTPEIIEKVEKLVLENTRLKKKQLTTLVGVSETTIVNILHQHLGMTKVCARWVTRILSADQKREPVEARIETGNETWVHHNEPESKQESIN
ncbi:protein GVQW3-like [Melitaea cinxia]|uniref:protein GVQW3-like n=1 Tax=Melitaea cinxia TaxID=113334 RepID=UPI001E270488|nr:protein GVQW3-like [Melitaea cinxia]